MMWIVFLAATARAAELLVGRQAGQELLSSTPRRVGEAGARGRGPLECFEVAGPVLSPQGLVDGNQLLGVPARGRAPEEGKSCVVTLMDHVFANSYGHPFVASYVPPTASSCPSASDFNRVIVNFTVVSQGRQFDRLAIMWLGDVEVWRTSTAEPKIHPGISWTYWKDMTSYLALWKRPQTLIFDLGNLINEKYNATLNATLTATFFRDKTAARAGSAPLAVPADQILPISAGRGSNHTGSAWTYPDEEATASVRLPRNARHAVVSLAATGQSDEEFWWSNVPEASKDTFNGSSLPGKGSFREVRLYIDGEMAGVSWPFPVVFTGGVLPSLNRPVVGPQAFDLREQEIDVTPWLGLLCDGKPHRFDMAVVGADDAVVNRYWLLSGKVFVWLDEKPDHVTTGLAPSVSMSKPNYELGDTSVKEQIVRYDQTVRRRLEVRSSIDIGSGRLEVAWEQAFTMRNRGVVLDAGNFQNVTAAYEGRDLATENGVDVFHAHYSYPILLSSKETPGKDNQSLTIEANLTQSMDLDLEGRAVFLSGLEAFVPFLDRDRVNGASVTTSKSGTAFLWLRDDGNKSTGFGSSHQVYSLSSLERSLPGLQSALGASTRQLYWRDISVVNETTTHDERRVYGLEAAAASSSAAAAEADPDRSNTHATNVLGRKYRRGRRG